MADWGVKASSATGVQYYANQLWNSGDRMVPAVADVSSNSTLAKAAVWECTTAGTTTATPTWPASITYDTTTVTQGTATFTARRPGYSSGSTWNWSFATPRLNYLGSSTSLAAGDRIFVSAGSGADTITAAGSALMNFSGGTTAAPILVVSADDSASPPTAALAGANVSDTAGSLLFNSAAVACYGLTCEVGAGGSGFVSFTMNGLYSEKCLYSVATTATNQTITAGAGSTLNQCDFKFGGATHVLSLNGAGIRISGGSIKTGSATLTNFLKLNTTGITAVVEGMDLSNLGTATNLITRNSNDATVTLSDCKLPTGWAGALIDTAITNVYGNYELWNCDDGTTNYRLWIERFWGTIKSETTIVRTGGYTDGTTPLSHRLASNTNAKFPVGLRSPDYRTWNDTTGSTVTATVEIVHDSQGAGTAAALQNDEVWIEVEYQSSSTGPLGAYTSLARGFLATAADQATSTATWTTTGLTTPVEQKLAVTFTPQKKGWVIARVVLAKASKTVYVDPKVTLT